MQQEHCTDAVGKVVDRAKLKEQLRQFHIDQETMKNKDVEYSPRFHRNGDLRITGSGDNRSSSPTFPLNLRISGKEKRRRVHAWLGAQIRSEAGSKHGNPTATAHNMTGNERTSSMPSHIVDGAGDGAREEDSEPLHSNSEFVAGFDLPLVSKHCNVPPVVGANSTPYSGKRDLMLEDYTSTKQKIPTSEGVIAIERSPTVDFTGGVDKYCYVYDPVVARAYTKKYTVDPPDKNISHSLPNSHILQDETMAKYLPASNNFTPSPASMGQNTNTIRSMPSETDTPMKSMDLGWKNPADGAAMDYSLPTKYEEYDMRPIKPLGAGLKKTLYGDTHNGDKDLPPPKPYPRPYLRRSQSTGVTYPAGKTTFKSKSSLSKQSTRIQNNLEPTSKVTSKKAHQHTPVTAKRRQIRRSPKDALPEIPSKQGSDNGQYSETSGDQEPTELYTPKLGELPVDLKHVQAATKIQAVWKGYKTRKLDPKVVEIRQEVRARRAEQYISVLCHEVQCLKENLDAEKKMRDLQTEAIRYIWSQLRMVQKRRSGEKGEGGSKKKSSDRRPRSKSNSPRRGMKRANASSTSPRPTASSVTRKSPRQFSQSSALNCDDDSDSINSCDENTAPQKTVDASWKEVPDENLFQNATPNIEIFKSCQEKQRQAADDTDEGRGTLVTDGEGNPAHSSAEEEKMQKQIEGSCNIHNKNLKTRSTIDVLQEQVLQLQEAMLALTDKFVDHNPTGTNLNASEEDLKLIPECQDTSIVCPQQKLEEIEKIETAQYAPEPALSARGDVPNISWKNALSILKSALCENELWALCEQAGHYIKRNPVKRYLALDNVYLRKDGRVEFKDILTEEVDDMYLAPEVLDKSSGGTVKSSVFSLSVVLWSAADWEMSVEEAPQLSDELESLLVDMSQDDPEKRADIDDVIHICEDHHAKTRMNSICVCSSLFAEVENAMILAKSGKANQKKIALEISRDQEMTAKKRFRESVVPDINSSECRSKLKPVSERILSPHMPPELTPHEKLMESLASCKTSLKKSPRPKVFTVRDMFVNNPELVHNLNILPGQRRKNQKAMRLVMRRQFPKDPASVPKPGVPTPPRALRAGVSEVANSSGHSSVILRWHPSKIFDKQGQEVREEKIIGYRIYVNGHPKGMVAGAKSRALLEGLRHLTEYRVHVRAVSPLGESDPSNTVIAHITSRPKTQLKNDADCVTSKQLPEKQAETPTLTSEVVHRKQPQAKPRLGAVFPTQQDKGNSETNCMKASNCAQEFGDDVIDRVLRKYGIQQTSTIVPGIASGSTLSPMPLRSRSQTASSSATIGLRNDEEMAKPHQSTSHFNETENSDSKNSPKGDLNVSLASGDATSKSIELLTQLKNELLS